MTADPIYWRWLYSPTTGDVTLSHNHESTAAEIPLHSDMMKERSEDDLLAGTAHRILNGWRVLDQDSKPVNDPHILDAVVKEIKRTG